MLVRRLLEVPHDLAGIGVERDRARREQVVARPELRIEAREGVAGAVIEKIGGGVVGGGLPYAAAADAPGVVVVLPGLRPRFARRRDREGAPDELAVIGVEGADPAAGAKLAAGALALEDEVAAACGADGERRSCEGLGFGRRRTRRGIGRRGRDHFPCDLPGLLVERDDAGVVGRHDHLVAEERDAAIGARLGNLGVVAPQRNGGVAAAHVELHHPRPGIGHVHEAVLDERRRLLLARQRAAGGAAADREHEFGPQILDVVAVDLGERRMP